MKIVLCDCHKYVPYTYYLPLPDILYMIYDISTHTYHILCHSFSASHPVLTQDSDASGKWVAQCADWRTQLGLPSGLKVWSPWMQAQGLNVTDRISELLDLVAASKLKELGVNLLKPLDFETKKEKLKDVFCDVSQNPKYRSFTNSDGVTGCLATSTILYSFGRDRLVTPFELALFQGHRRGVKYPSGMRGNEIKSLAGEGMFLPSLATVIWSMYLLKGLP